MWVKCGIFTTPASGTTVIDITSKGNDAKGIHMWGGQQTANDSNTPDAHCWHAFSDGTNDRFGLVTMDSNATWNGQRWAANADLVPMRNANDDTILLSITAAAMNANDVTLTYGTFSANQIIHYEIYGGSDCSVEVGDYAVDTPNPFTGLSNGQPDLILWNCTGQTSIAANSIHAFQAFGVSHDTGSGIEQWCMFSWWSSTGTQQKGSGLSPSFHIGQYDTTDFGGWQNTITSHNSNGFTWTGTNADQAAYMAIVTGDRDVQIGTFNKATGGAPASQDIDTLRFTPQFYHLGTSGWAGTAINVDRDSRNFHGAWDGTDQVSVGSTVDQPTHADSHCRSRANEVLFYSTNLTQDGVVASATAGAMTDTTPSIEWNPNDGVAITIGYYAVEEEAAALTREQDSFRFYGDGTEDLSASLATQNTDITIAKETTFQTRVGTQYAGDPPTEAVTLQYRDTGDADGEYRDIP